MRHILYIVGAGLTKALERPPFRVPLMTDFVSVMADHLDDDVILTHLAEMENADLFEYPSADAKQITPDLASGRNRSPEARARFREILKERPAENIEALLERSVKKGGGDAAPARFSFAINRLFCRIGWRLNLKPLRRFLWRQFRMQDALHTFVSFNYELVLDYCVQLEAKGAWNIQRGYGFDLRYYVDPSEGADHMKQFESAGAFSILEATKLDRIEDDCPTTILKPHGSLNFIFPFEGNYNFKDGPAITVLSRTGALAYYEGFDIQHVARPAQGPDANRGLYVLPPAFSKTSDLVIIRAVRERQSRELEAADEIYVIGWSMPPTDVDQQNFITAAMERRTKPLDRLVVVNHRAPDEYFDRLSATFRVSTARMEVHNCGFADFVKRTSRIRFGALAWLTAGLITLMVWAFWRDRS